MLETRDVQAEHQALREGGQQRAGVERAVPPRFVVSARFHAEVERHAAQDQPRQHQRHGQVELGQDHAVRNRKGHQQQAHAKHQPGLVGIPERADGGDHGVLVGIVRPAQQHAHAQVVAVQDHVDQHRDAHQGQEHQRHPAGGLGQVGHSALRNSPGTTA